MLTSSTRAGVAYVDKRYFILDALTGTATWQLGISATDLERIRSLKATSGMHFS